MTQTYSRISPVAAQRKMMCTYMTLLVIDHAQQRPGPPVPVRFDVSDRISDQSPTWLGGMQIVAWRSLTPGVSALTWGAMDIHDPL